MKLTTIEQMIADAVNSRPNTWLNCHGAYIGEALALQAKSVIETRIIDNQLSVRLQANPHDSQLRVLRQQSESRQ